MAVASRRKARPQGTGASKWLDTCAPDLGGYFSISLFNAVALVAAAARLVTTGVPQNSRTHPSLVFLFEPTSPPPNPLPLVFERARCDMCSGHSMTLWIAFGGLEAHARCCRARSRGWRAPTPAAWTLFGSFLVQVSIFACRSFADRAVIGTS